MVNSDIIMREVKDMHVKLNRESPYDEIAETYDSSRFSTIRGRIFKFFRARILKKFMKSCPQQGLAFDLACGTGLISGWLLKKGYQLVAGDLSIGMLNITRNKIFSSNGVVGLSRLNACCLPFKDKSFDVVTSFRFLNLIPPDTRVEIHKEVARIGKDAYIFSYALDSAYQRFRGRVKTKFRISGQEGSDKNAATISDMAKELDSAGIEIVETFMVLPFLTSELVVSAIIRE